MNSRFLLAILIAWIFAIPTHAQAPAAEKQKIEALLTQVGNLADAKFVRNGSDYDAATAVKFLRGKWSRSDAEIKTAQDFIAKAGTASGTSGKPYMIRFKDGREVKCADYLKGELAKIEEPAAKPK
jgi:hypothetical protein